MSAPAMLNLGPVEQIPFGEGRTFDVLGEQVAIFRLRSGRLYAVGAVCPHKGGPIADGQIDGAIVVCPLHLNTFELATGCSLSGQPGLGSWPVSVDDDGDLVLEPRRS